MNCFSDCCLRFKEGKEEEQVYKRILQVSNFRIWTVVRPAGPTARKGTSHLWLGVFFSFPADVWERHLGAVILSQHSTWPPRDGTCGWNTDSVLMEEELRTKMMLHGLSK